MSGPSPPRLVIPTASVSPARQSPVTQTGRPSLWTSSALRKMIRLYVYTDLKVPQIVKIVHHCESNGQEPGVDSANKKLNAMLDAQPRWLRPTSPIDMSERLEKLAHSPTRTAAPPFQLPVRPHSASDPSPYSYRAANFIGEATTPSPYALSPQSALTPDINGCHSFTYSPPVHDDEIDSSLNDLRDRSGDITEAEEAFKKFVRSTTCMSTSTDHTTGSFQDLLPEKSQPYVQAIRRLVKRFTVPVNNALGASPVHEEDEEPSTWADERDCPVEYNHRPFPLPGDFVSQGVYDTFGQCTSHEDHSKRWCLCAAHADMPPSPWVLPGGLTQRAERFVNEGPQSDDFTIQDSYGNTILHFIALNGSPVLVSRLIGSGQCDRILNTMNTAGQTFMHLLGHGWEWPDLNRLFKLIAAKGFVMSARDHYGRTVFHSLIYHGVPPQHVAHLLQYYGHRGCVTRDAFGLIPSGRSENNLHPHYSNEVMDFNGTTPTEDSDKLLEAQVLRDVSSATQNPTLEDLKGCNGLQSLAAATLSVQTVVAKNNLPRRTPSQRGQKRGDRTPEQDSDSSKTRMQFRLELAEQLVDAGVDVNHYDSNGNTPLMAFAAELPEDDDYKTGAQILELLISNGANINARNRRGETALHIAVRCGRKLAVKCLQQNGANLYARDADGRSVLQVADVKIRNTANSPKKYAHFEACRAWLSGKDAVQEPTVLQEWGVPR